MPPFGWPIGGWRQILLLGNRTFSSIRLDGFISLLLLRTTRVLCKNVVVGRELARQV